MNNKERVGLIMDYEGGEISEGDALKLFSNLIKTGLVWSLQGHYGRTAQSLIATPPRGPVDPGILDYDA